MASENFTTETATDHAAPAHVETTGHGDSATGMEHPQQHTQTATHGLPLDAPVLWHLGPVPITNSMLIAWLATILIIFFARRATAKLREVPQGAQNFWEWLVESLLNFLEGIMGSHLARKTFWFFATIFITILVSNWVSLVPGVGTIGWGETHNGDFHATKPLLRGAAADLNFTFAIAIISSFLWLVWGIQENGIKGFLGHIFGSKAESSGFMKIFFILVFLAVGVLEVISIMFRPITLSFRLFGNIFAGENLIESMMLIAPAIVWKVLVTLPFYFLEVFVGLVQALVFTLLTAVFVVLICSHDDHESHEKHGHAAAHAEH